MQKCIVKKYYYKTFCYDVEIYIRDHSIYLISKTIKYKLYGNS